MKLIVFISLFLTLSFSFASDMSDAEDAAKLAAAEAPVVVEKTEDQIPVNFNKSKKADSPEASSGKMVLSFGLMALILGLGYYFAKRYAKPANVAQTKIKILNQHFLGPKKSLAIVRVAGESVLIGITDHSISMIKSLSLLDDEIPESVSGDFKQTFNEQKQMDLNQTEAKTQPSATQPSATQPSGEEFSIRHIKDVVSLKLKGIRNDL